MAMSRITERGQPIGEFTSSTGTRWNRRRIALDDLHYAARHRATRFVDFAATVQGAVDRRRPLAHSHGKQLGTAIFATTRRATGQRAQEIELGACCRFATLGVGVEAVFDLGKLAIEIGKTIGANRFQGCDHPIAIAPGLRIIVIDLASAGFCKPRHVQPMSSPTLTKMGRSEKFVDESFLNLLLLGRVLGM